MRSSSVVEALLREDVVEDVREPPVGLDERVGAHGLADERVADRRTRRSHSRKQMPHSHSFPAIGPQEIPRKGELRKGPG